MRPREQNPSTGARDHEWAVILAGGDGTRLKSLTRHIAGVRPRWAEAAVPQFS
jgi:ADP-glucose pyrophosphorylase